MTKETETFPSWRYGPGEQAAIFDRVEDVPEGWEDAPGKVKGAEEPDPDDEMKALRAAYREKFGKGPGPRWGADEIRKRME